LYINLKGEKVEKTKKTFSSLCFSFGICAKHISSYGRNTKFCVECKVSNFIPESARNSAVKYGVNDFAALNNPKDMTEIENLVSSGYDVMIDFDAYMSGNGNRYVYNPNATMGPHVTLIVGYDRTQKQFLLKNSWGENQIRFADYSIFQNTATYACYVKSVRNPNAPNYKMVIGTNVYGAYGVKN